MHIDQIAFHCRESSLAPPIVFAALRDLDTFKSMRAGQAITTVIPPLRHGMNYYNAFLSD